MTTSALHKVLRVIPKSLVFYQDGLALQHDHIHSIRKKFDGSMETVPKSVGSLIMLEHFPVYTLGIRSTKEEVDSTEYLKQIGAEVFHSNRGGLITFHGPGQLVAYPIIDVEAIGVRRVRHFVNKMEDVIIKTLADFSIKSDRDDKYVGVWVGQNKICALGMNFSGGISSHGIALNCTTDLKWYSHITPCGILNRGVTSISKELNKNVPVSEVCPIFEKHFQQVFNCSLVNN